MDIRSVWAWAALGYKTGNKHQRRDPSPLQKIYTMYPSSNRFQTAPFGEERIREIVMKTEPDIIFTINDMWIVNEQYKQIQDMHKDKRFKFIGYVPMDSYNWVGCLTDTANDWDGITSKLIVTPNLTCTHACPEASPGSGSPGMHTPKLVGN